MNVSMNINPDRETLEAEMSKRIISGAVIAVITILALYFDGLLFTGMLGFIALYSTYEYIKIKGKFNILLYIITAVSVFALIYFNEYSDIIILIELILLMSIGVFDPEETYVDLSGVLLFSILIGFALYYMNNIEHLNKWMLGYIFIISYITDVFAFFTGKFFGKHKLNERVSPKKTVEGSIGGFIFGCIFSFLWAYYFRYFGYPSYLFILSSILLPIVSEIGDLVFSLIKRHYDVKDFSSLIPGHGGILDRLDSIIFCIITFGVLLTILV